MKGIDRIKVNFPSGGRMYVKDSKTGQFVDMGYIVGVDWAKDGEAPMDQQQGVNMTPDYVEPLMGWRLWGLETDFPDLMSMVSAPYPPRNVFYLGSLVWPGLKAWRFQLPAMASCFCAEKKSKVDTRLEKISLTEYSDWEESRLEKRHSCQEEKCGLYAHDTPQNFLQDLLMNLPHYMLAGDMKPLVVGQVALWGQVDVHERGFRADYGYPTKLMLVEESFYDIELDYRQRYSRFSHERYINIAKDELERNYGVPVTFTELREMIWNWLPLGLDIANTVLLTLSHVIQILEMKGFCLVEGREKEKLTPREVYVHGLFQDLLREISSALDAGRGPDAKINMDFVDYGWGWRRR